jgi:hypothetical protein
MWNRTLADLLLYAEETIDILINAYGSGMNEFISGCLQPLSVTKTI